VADIERALKTMNVPRLYHPTILPVESLAIIEASFEEMLGKGGIILFGERAKKIPTIVAVEMLKLAFKNRWMGYFIDIYGLLNDARATTYSTEDATTVWKHCKETQFLVLNNIADAFVFSEYEQRLLAELLVHRQDNKLYTIIVIYGNGEDEETRVRVFGRPVADIIAGFAIKKVE